MTRAIHSARYKLGGVQYAEGHALRGGLDATVKVVETARKLWVG
ncbi:hypothetical protein ABQF33_22350 [Mycolicibacterium sp. XJ2]